MRGRETEQALARQRDEARAWWKGTRGSPLVLDHHEGFCVCDVMTPSPARQLLASWRALLAMAACQAPFSAMKVAVLRLLGARIGKNVFISPGALIDPCYPELIEIEDNALLGFGCHVFAHEYTARQYRVAPVRIGRGAVIGGFSTVRCGVKVGAGATVGCNSFVNRDVPDGATVGGVPARVLKGEEPCVRE